MKTFDKAAPDSPDHASRVYTSPMKPMFASQVPAASASAVDRITALAVGGQASGIAGRAPEKKRQFYHITASASTGAASSQPYPPPKATPAKAAAAPDVVLTDTSAADTDEDTPPFNRSADGTWLPPLNRAGVRVCVCVCVCVRARVCACVCHPPWEGQLRAGRTTVTVCPWVGTCV